MKIKKFMKNIALSDDNGKAQKYIHTLEESLRKQAKGFDVYVRDFLGNFFFKQEWDSVKNTRATSEISIMLEYKEGVDAPTVHRDLTSLSLVNMARRRPNIDMHPTWVRKYEPNALFNRKHHSLWFPFTLDFGENYKNLEEQQNELNIHVTAEPTKKLQQEIQRYCKSQKVQCEIYVSEKGQSGYYNLFEEHGMSSSPKPEARVEVKWPGQDFDKKALSMYGAIGTILLDNHKKTVKKFISIDMSMAYGDKIGPILNQESIDGGYKIDHLVCHMHSKIPFKAKDKNRLAEISYYHFRGH